jgi:hypothetical protein
MQVFPGTIAPGENTMFEFTLPATQELRMTLASLTDAAGLPLGTPVTFSFGVVSATDNTVCDPLTSITNATARLTSHIAVIAAGGAYCVGLTDTSGLPVTAHLSIRLIYGVPSDAEQSGTISYTSTVVPTGSTSRTFAAAENGTASITMESFQTPGVTALGLAVGIQRNDGTGCEVAATLVASAGQVLNVPVDAGRYCVKVYDPGTLMTPATFTIRIQHP